MDFESLIREAMLMSRKRSLLNWLKDNKNHSILPHQIAQSLTLEHIEGLCDVGMVGRPVPPLTETTEHMVLWRVRMDAVEEMAYYSHQCDIHRRSFMDMDTFIANALCDRLLRLLISYILWSPTDKANIVLDDVLVSRILTSEADQHLKSIIAVNAIYERSSSPANATNTNTIGSRPTTAVRPSLLRSVTRRPSLAIH
jgi:hypothetical protein